MSLDGEAVKVAVGVYCVGTVVQDSVFAVELDEILG